MSGAQRAQAAEERRTDPADGNSYTRQDFIDQYGGTVEWDKAAPSSAGGPLPKTLNLSST